MEFGHSNEGGVFVLRDNLKPLEYFKARICSSEKFIQRGKYKIIDLKEDIKNGINRFPKDNESIICSTYQTNAIYEMKKMCLIYSAGMSIEYLNEDFEYTVLCMENYDEQRAGYLNLLWMVSLGILLETDKSNIERLSKIVEKEKIKDGVIDYLLCASGIDWGMVNGSYVEENPYAKTKEIIELAQKDKKLASDRLKKYMEKEWFQGHYDYGWKNAHKEPGYVGFWSFETAALAKILELDDSSLMKNNHYPYDLAHYKNTMKFKQVSITEDNNKEVIEAKKGIEINPELERVIPIKWHSFINELIYDYRNLDDSNVYKKYKKSIGLDQLWFLLDDYKKENKDKNLLGSLIVFALNEQGYILQLDYKEGLEDYYPNMKNYWGDSDTKLIQFVLDNNQNYYALVPKDANVEKLYEVTVVDVE